MSMRNFATCFYTSLLILCMFAPGMAAEELDLSDLEAKTEQPDPATQATLEAMRRDFERVSQVSAKIPPERATEAWRRYLATYAADLAGTNEDDALRAKATALMMPSVVAAPVAAPVAKSIVPKRLGEQIEAYRLAKRTDFSDAPVIDKIQAWNVFLAACADDISNSTLDDEQRQRAKARLAVWVASPKATIP